MLTPSLSLSPTATDLEDLFVSSGQEAFHAEFRRRVEKPRTGRNGIDMGLGGRSGNPVGGFYFDISLMNKKEPDGLNDVSSCPKRTLASYQSPVFRHGFIP
jgi:hypothetical protein